MAACVVMRNLVSRSARVSLSRGTAIRASSTYAERMFEAWKQKPSSVHSSWDNAFRKMESSDVFAAVAPITIEDDGASLDVAGLTADDALHHFRVHSLIRAFRVSGHTLAKMDPLGLWQRPPAPECDLAWYDFTEADLNKEFHFACPNTHTLFPNHDGPITLNQILEKLNAIYTSNVGYQFKHIQDETERNWIQREIEMGIMQEPLSAEEKQVCLYELIKSDGFEKFLQKKYGSEKRFGLDGCEVLIPGLKALMATSSQLGVTNTVIGMPHRGRLNVLVNVMGKPMEALLYEFSDHLAPDDEGQGDVKYHLGLSNNIELAPGRKMHVSLVANPSHLEAVDPVVVGKCRAAQDYRGGESERSHVLPLLMHGDAAFSGQGVVFETIGMSALPAYNVGGAIHVVVNNQVGFTTDPRFSRSSDYCTDLGVSVGCPIVHVNGDCVEDVIRVFKLASTYRQQFGKDFIIDLVCYRRFGHNEGDQPAFTQPLMYQSIDRHTPTLHRYSDQLKSESVVNDDWIVERITEYEAANTEAYNKAQPDGGYSPLSHSHYDVDTPWHGFKQRAADSIHTPTGIDYDMLKEVGQALSTYPKDFKIHSALKRIFKQRAEAVKKQEGLDWSMGEGLAFGSLLLEGTTVRLSGQDVERGTFSHRHHVLHDQETDNKLYNCLNNIRPGQPEYYVHNSHLAEFAVLGFELGFAQHSPYALVCWEAQFGDFANTAQCIIDQFISSGEEKWGRQNGLVMLLPHGYEGMGPEHSSCRIERFLQMCDDNEDSYPDFEEDFAINQIRRCNMQVVNCTTPANYFHVLRRQTQRDFRKPLVVATPKSLLRHPLAKSTFEDIGPGTRFKRLIPETDAEILSDADGVNNDVKRLVLCSGKVYYDLLEERTKQGNKEVALARVEQLNPFPYDLVLQHADQFPNAEIVWAQEEPKNMGSWGYVRRRIETALSKSTIHNEKRAIYAGRPSSAATATGNKLVHKAEQHDLIESALNAS
eukprot:m.336714 g.336714  ORF g.336714 m.336714 type:complete len:986 (-) comp17940_c0_seq1:108-3065(-)